MRIKLINFLVWLYKIIIFAIILLIEPVFEIPLLGRVRYYLAIINIGIAFIIYVMRKKFTVNKRNFFYFLSNIVPYMLVFLFMITRAIVDENINFTKQIEVFLYWLIPMLLMHSAIFLFGYKAVDYTFWTLIFNYMICVVLYLAIYKLDGVIHFFYYVEKEVTPLEVHELTLSMGLFFLYYVFFENKNVKNHNFKIALCVIALFLGFKRIEIFALIVVSLLIKFIKKMGKANEIKIVKVISFFFIFVSLAYIVIIRAGILEDISEKYDINFNTRLEAYRYFEEDYDLSILYPGKGLGYAMEKLSLAGSLLRGIGDLHNDVLKIYIEFGAILWAIYFFNFSILQVKRLKKIFNEEVSKLYFVLMVFTYILYLTDNVNRYLIYILVFTMLPYAHYLYIKENVSNDKKKELEDDKK